MSTNSNSSNPSHQDFEISNPRLETELNRLNPQQLATALHPQGPALVLAGAGSGKTKVLTTRAAWLLETKQAGPEEILLVTFTNKASSEIKKRVHALVGGTLNYSGTFHSLCAKILRRHAPAVGLDYGFSIYDGDDQLTLLKNIYKAEGWDPKQYKPASILGAISRAKNNLLTPQTYEEQAQGSFAEFTARAYKIYQHQLKREQAVDFDDLLNYTVWLFRDHQDVLDHYQAQIKHVLVDEYQDTNKAQYQLTKYLARPQNNLFAVGDFSQSIYAWRGADYRNMNYLEQDFPDLHKYYLEQNYRSLQPILTAATQVISQNSEHPILDLWTEKTQETKIGVLEADSSQQEAFEITKMIDQLINQDHLSPNEIAILYRTNAQSRAFEEALTQFAIPYKIIGGFKFYERKEVKDLLGYLRVLVNPQDSVSLTRITKIGKRRLAKFTDWKEQKKLAQNELQTDTWQNPYQLLKEIVEVTSYKDFYQKDDPEDATHLENIEELLHSASLFDDTSQFLENVALIQDDYLVDADLTREEVPQVVLMSLHSAKGLEFQAVFMVGLEEGLLPHSRTLFDPSEVEEERRLCYVGMTRAKEKLHLSFARKRWQYGDVTFAQQSRFLSEIDKKLLDWNTKEENFFETNNQRGNGGGQSNKKRAWSNDWNSSWGANSNSHQKKPVYEKKLEGERKIVIDDSLLDDLLRDDIDISEFLRS